MSTTPTIPFGTAGYVSGGAFTYYALLSDGDDVVSRPGNLQMAAAKQLRGAILKRDPATGNVTVPAVETDCNCILALDCDATLAIAPCQVYVGGKFKADAVIWPGALSHPLITDALRNMDIQLESVVFTDGSLVKTSPTQVQTEAAKKVIDENRGRIEKQAKAQTTKPDEGRDSPWAYLTPEERVNNPALATIHDREDAEEEEREKEKEDREKEKGDDSKRDPSRQPSPAHHPQHGNQTPKPKGGD